MPFTHLYVETNYAMNGSNITIEELIKKAVSYGYSSLAITDPKMYGVVKFYKECIKNNIKPIIGLSIYCEGLIQGSKNRYLLYAKNNAGYQSLLRIASFSAINGVVSLRDIKTASTGIIAVLITDESELIGFYQNNQANEINEFINLQKTYFEISYISISSNKHFNFDLDGKFSFITVPRVSYLNADDKIVSNTLKTIFQLDNSDLLGENSSNHFTNIDEVKQQFDGYDKAMKKVDEIVKLCNVSLDFSVTHLPRFKLKDNVTAKDYLKALAYKGLSMRIKGQKVDLMTYQNRLDFELKVIDEMGYNDYFLIVWDFVKYAKQKKYLVGPGRGSAAASLVSYCLGITSVDSIKYDLVFERFLNPERITLPDIDMDFPDDKRDDVIKYVRDVYGIDRVASICTFGTFLSKSALRDTARVSNFEGLLLNQIVKETEGYNNINEMINDSEKIKNIISQNKEAKSLLEIASRIEGLHRHTSTHAAGIIVSQEKMTTHTAVQSGLLEMMQTQYEAKDLEGLGLLKIDFLGIRNLTSINRILDLINEKENKVIDIYKVPLDDMLTFDLLKRVETTGIFQLESKGMRSLIGNMQINSFEDIVTILALFRPGPMENIPAYLRRRNNEEEVTYPHKILEDVLKSTNGIIIYQEQIIKIASLFAGYSLGEADLLRRAVSKKQLDVLNKERTNFVMKAKNLGRDDKTSNEIYDYIVKFANYGFNRAHSVAYAMVSYWMAYLKANYPKYFISIMTTSVIGSEAQMKEYIFEANKLGVRIVKPSVNYSTGIFNPDGDNLRYPLLGIKNFGRAALKSLLEEREKGLFKSFFDFISRTHKSLNKRVLESLIYAGALDEFKYSKQAMINQLEEVINFSLYGDFISQDEFVIEEFPEYDFTVLEEKEKSVVGFNLFVNPLLPYTKYIKKHKLKKPSELTFDDIGKELRVVGIISNIRKIKTKNNQDMAFISLQDEYIKMDGVLFTSTYRIYQEEIMKNKVFLLMCKIDERNGSLQLVVNKVHKLD